MYAISHAATALVLKRRYPSASLWTLLISVQAVEVLWVVLVYLGIEHVDYTTSEVHLGFLPYSHSVGSGMLAAWLGWALLRRNREVALAIALGVMSHIVLDIIQHEPNITLLPIAAGPRLGLGLMNWPLANFIVEIAYGIACWFIFRGGKGLLVAIIVLNIADLPLMMPQPDSAAMLGAHPAVLPTIILIQILLTWTAIWFFARPSHGVQQSS